MKILHISNYRNWGGGTAIARALAGQSPEHSLLLILEPNGRSTGPDRSHIPEYTRGFSDFSGVRHLVETLLRDDPAMIIHCHGRRPGIFGQFMRALHPKAVRTVLSFHGAASFGATKKAFVAIQESILSLVTDQFIAAAPAEVEMFRHVPLAAPIALIPYAYNPDALVRWTNRPISRIGFCARFAPPKLHSYLIRLVAAYNDKAIMPVNLVFSGDGPTRAAADALGRQLLGERYVSLGHLKDIREFYGQVDLFAHFSLYEGLPIALIDAMACGLPCIATDVIGCRDAIENGVSGLLVPLGNIPAGVMALDRIIKSPDDASRLSANALKRAELEYSPALFWQRHRYIYDKLGAELTR